MFVYAIYIHICVWWPHWWVSGKEPTCQAGDMGFDSWVRKMPCRRKWQPTPVFLLGKSHGRADPLEKTPILEKTEGKRRRGQLRMSWFDNITDSMDMNLSKLWEIVEDREDWQSMQGPKELDMI